MLRVGSIDLNKISVPFLALDFIVDSYGRIFIRKTYSGVAYKPINESLYKYYTFAMYDESLSVTRFSIYDLLNYNEDLLGKLVITNDDGSGTAIIYPVSVVGCNLTSMLRKHSENRKSKLSRLPSVMDKTLVAYQSFGKTMVGYSGDGIVSVYSIGDYLCFILSRDMWDLCVEVVDNLLTIDVSVFLPKKKSSFLNAQLLNSNKYTFEIIDMVKFNTLLTKINLSGIVNDMFG